MNYPNYLYAPHKDKIAILCREYMKLPNLCVGEQRDLKIEDNIRKCIEIGVQLWGSICENCTGNHEWFIAGGYTSFCAGYTSRFGDIDIFIYCTKDLTEINNYDAIQRPDTVNIQKWTNNVINMLFHGYENADETLQFVQVNFDIKTEIPSDIKFLDLMMMYVLSNFDLPVCKIAMKIFDNSTYVMDLRALEGVDPKTKTERQEKYKRRTINNIKMQVPSLMTLSLRSIFKSD